MASGLFSHSKNNKNEAEHGQNLTLVDSQKLNNHAHFLALTTFSTHKDYFVYFQHINVLVYSEVTVDSTTHV